MEQTFFDYQIKPNVDIDNFFVGNANQNAYNYLIKDNLNSSQIFLNGPLKSGKTHLSLIWKKKFNAIIYNNNIKEIINLKRNILIDDVFTKIIEEEVFHIINHCNSFNLKLLVTSNLFLNDYNFKLNDLSSRLKSFINLRLNLPDDELLMNLMVKLFSDKQIIVKNPEIFNYILKRADRSYEQIFFLIDRIDKLLLKKNKQLTIPLIKELI